MIGKWLIKIKKRKEETKRSWSKRSKDTKLSLPVYKRNATIRFPNTSVPSRTLKIFCSNYTISSFLFLSPLISQCIRLSTFFSSPFLSPLSLPLPPYFPSLLSLPTLSSFLPFPFLPTPSPYSPSLPLFPSHRFSLHLSIFFIGIPFTLPSSPFFLSLCLCLSVFHPSLPLFMPLPLCIASPFPLSPSLFPFPFPSLSPSLSLCFLVLII